MSASLSKQTSFQFSQTVEGGGTTPTSEVNAKVSASKPIDFPDFNRYGGVANYAITARLAGRMNASSVSPTEHRNLLRERENLLKKKYEDGLSPREGRRLEYIRWSLDRIEDAKHGAALDALEAWVEHYEQFNADINGLLQNLNRNIPKR